jgi:peptidoglycan/LPS O-acetylase OafA/YrhL
MRRYPELDGLRGIAASVIVLYHLRFTRSFPLGQTAVDLFFVLSGFLITRGLIVEAGRPGWLHAFYSRRIRRIWPAYYLAMALVVALNPWLPKPEPLAEWWRFATFTPFVSRYWHVEPSVFSRLFYHAWTLAIEEQFYLAWPLILLVLGRRGLAVACAALIVLPAWLRAADGLSPNLLLTRCEGLALGAALALWRGRDERPFGRRGRMALLGLALLMLSVPILPGSLQILRLNLLFAALVGLVIDASGHRFLAFLRSPALSALGRVSYGLYLYHPIVFALVTVAHRRLGLPGSLGWDVVKVALSVAVAAASWRWVESPFLKRRRRASPGESRHPVGWAPPTIPHSAIPSGHWPQATGHSQRSTAPPS